MPGAHLLLSGQRQVQCDRAGTLVEQFADTAIWDLMYVGHAR